MRHTEAILVEDRLWTESGHRLRQKPIDLQALSPLFRNNRYQPSDRRAGAVFLHRLDHAPHGSEAKRQGCDLSSILGVATASGLGGVIGLDLLHVFRQSVDETRIVTLCATQ